jgi:hypothetical protein
MNERPKNNAFKSCPNCNRTWQSHEDFLDDPEIEVIGYQVQFNSLEEGLFLFNHHTCKSTLSILSGKFTGLYNGQRYVENLRGTENCPEYCLFQSNLEPCPEKCECAYIRNVIDQIKNWKKTEKIRK